jgi:hypothetical protein
MSDKSACPICGDVNGLGACSPGDPEVDNCWKQAAAQMELLPPNERVHHFLHIRPYLPGD